MKKYYLLAALLGAVGVQSVQAQNYGFSVLAGGGAVIDHLDGSGTNARFLNPTGVAYDKSGNIYVADGGAGSIRKISGGNVTTLASGFTYPFAVAVDNDGNVYFTDIGDNTIRKIFAGGGSTVLAGSSGLAGSADGIGTSALFRYPQGITVDAAGNVYVADTDNHVIRKITPNTAVSTFVGASGQFGSADGSGGNARFNAPSGLAIDATGNIYVADFGNSTIRRITPSGAVSTVAGAAGQSGTTNGPGGSARFDHPAAVSVDNAGNIYVADTSSQTIRKITTTGVVSTLAGNPGFGGTADAGGASASFFYPFGIASDGAGNLVVADTGNHTLRTVSPDGSVFTAWGAVGAQGSADGNGTSARFSYPQGVAVDGNGNVYVADHNNNIIRKITPDGTVSTLAGAAGIAGSADGAGGAARFNGPADVAVDGSGNVYVADAGNSTIRKISPSGVVTTFAGAAGAAGSGDGVGASARFRQPQGVEVDAGGNVYVADTNNSTIRKISPAGSVVTLAGAAGQFGSADGNGGSARFSSPVALGLDGAGNIYVSDFDNATIRKVTGNGIVTTIAGFSGQFGNAGGSGSQVRFNQPYSLAVDSGGTVYVADTYNRVIRKVTATGATSNISGTTAHFYYAQGIAIDGSGNLYVADGDNQVILKGSAISPPVSGGQVDSKTVQDGGTATFSVATQAFTSYQWQVSTDGGVSWANVTNGGAYSGATTATLTIAATTAMNGYRYRVNMNNEAGGSTSAAGSLTVNSNNVTPPPVGPNTGSARLVNLSARAFVGTGDNTLFLGYVMKGGANKNILLRGIGPTLGTLGVGGTLGAPMMTVFDANNKVLTTATAWGGSATLASLFKTLGAFALPATSADAAFSRTMAPGLYTTRVEGVGGGTGVALAEIYDADGGDPATRLANLAARGYVGTGDQVMICGLVLGGSGTRNILIRGVGPGLNKLGVPGALGTTKITVVEVATNKVVASATSWNAGLSSTFTAVGAFAFDPGSADSAVLLSLNGNAAYTVQLEGLNGQTGVGMLEIYDVP